MPAPGLFIIAPAVFFPFHELPGDEVRVSHKFSPRAGAARRFCLLRDGGGPGTRDRPLIGRLAATPTQATRELERFISPHESKTTVPYSGVCHLFWCRSMVFGRLPMRHQLAVVRQPYMSS